MAEENAIADYVARGLASEALQTFRSHDALDTLRFANMEDKQEEIRRLIADLRQDMQTGFKSYDSKFWSLAVTTITLLAAAVASLIFKSLFH